VNKPATTRSCGVEDCVENWVCGAWSACVNGLFTRTCTDSNNCGTFVDEPYHELLCDASTPAPAAGNNPGNPSNPGSGDVNNVYNNYYINYGNGNTKQPNYTINYTDFHDEIVPIWDIPSFPLWWIIWIIILLLILLLLYIYISCAFSSIAERTDNYPGGVAWIPIIGPLLISRKAAKMHWWPVLLVIALPIEIASSFLMFMPSIPVSIMAEFMISAVCRLALLVLLVFSFIWMWKTFKAVGRPGWWVLFNLIPFLGFLIFLILLGVAAWGRGNKPEKKVKGSRRK
jgi:hypothetical protein